MKNGEICCDCLYNVEGTCHLDKEGQTPCGSYEPFYDHVAPYGASIEEEAPCSRCHRPSGLMKGGNTWYFCDTCNRLADEAEIEWQDRGEWAKKACPVQTCREGSCYLQVFTQESFWDCPIWQDLKEEEDNIAHDVRDVEAQGHDCPF